MRGSSIAGRAAHWWSVIAAAALLAASLALFWPGIAEYDTVDQFQQVVTGQVRDWHPPLMVRLWQVLHGLFGGGTQPMLVLQLTLYWLGLGLVAEALAGTGRRWSAAAVLVIGLFPPCFGWLGIVLKDGQMVGATMAAVGLVAAWRLRGKRLPRTVLVPVTLLFGYALLVRANGVFALAPLIVLLAGGLQRPGRAMLATVALTLTVVAVEAPIAHRLLGADETGVAWTEPGYDLAGIAVRTGADVPGLTREQSRAIAVRGCAAPLFWDQLGPGGRCSDVLPALMQRPAGAVWIDLARAAARHPLAYAAHRLAHLNSTERWLVPPNWPLSDPPEESEPNPYDLRQPGAAATWLEQQVTWLNTTPLGWPVAWIVVAATMLAVALRRQSAPPRDLAVALLVSALALEASFVVISVSSDLRYHLWPMLATALSTVLLAERPARAERLLVGATVLAFVLAAGFAARATLPPVADDYAELSG